eukprot:543769-Prorocentrum_minimum.AAC.1
MNTSQEPSNMTSTVTITVTSQSRRRRVTVTQSDLGTFRAINSALLAGSGRERIVRTYLARE